MRLRICRPSVLTVLCGAGGTEDRGMCTVAGTSLL
jgi:hypothetical protein